MATTILELENIRSEWCYWRPETFWWKLDHLGCSLAAGTMEEKLLTGARAATPDTTQSRLREKIILTFPLLSPSSLPPMPLISQISRKPESKGHRKCDVDKAEKKQVIDLRQISRRAGQAVSCSHLRDREPLVMYLFCIPLRSQ